MLSPDSNLASPARTPAQIKSDPPLVTGAVTKFARRLLSILSSAERKKYPISSGVMDYFPDAIAMVAHISYLGNEKHNPGQPLHWSRGKSNDHEDCIMRHTIERDTIEDGVFHAANRCWRDLAALQEMCEAHFKLDPPRGAK